MNYERGFEAMSNAMSNNYGQLAAARAVIIMLLKTEMDYCPYCKKSKVYQHKDTCPVPVAQDWLRKNGGFE